MWSSTVGSHQYTIKEDDSPKEEDKMVRGTRVVLHLKVQDRVVLCCCLACFLCVVARLSVVQCAKLRTSSSTHTHCNTTSKHTYPCVPEN